MGWGSFQATLSFDSCFSIVVKDCVQEKWLMVYMLLVRNVQQFLFMVQIPFYGHVNSLLDLRLVYASFLAVGNLNFRKLTEQPFTFRNTIANVQNHVDRVHALETRV